MAIDLLNDRGCEIGRQHFNWKELVQSPLSKLNEDAFSRARVLLMSALEAQANRFQHACARMNRHLQLPLARVRRAEQHQQTLVQWLLPPDLSPLETTLAHEQVAIELTASLAQSEPDPYLAQVYTFGVLEDFDHLYRFSALYDRVEGKDTNTITQSYTDIRPGRPTSVQHRAPQDDLRASYDRKSVDPITKLNALTILGAEHQTHDYYMAIGPLFADPIARQLYAEIASIEEQHVTQYECLIDPEETWMEKWLLHEATEVYQYHACVESETNPRLKAIWERFLDYELGHLTLARDLFEKIERRDPAEILPASLPAPVAFESQRDFIRDVLLTTVDLRARDTAIVDRSEENPASLDYRVQVNAEGSPSEAVASGYVWTPGTELQDRKAA